jgi:hypothetical protein
MRNVRRFCVAFLVALCAGASAPAAFASSSAQTPAAVVAQAPTDSVAPDSTAVDLNCAKPGVERPNCGVKPQQAGDRGGWLQYTVWALLIVGLIVIFTVVFRSAARTNRAKTTEVGERNWS